MLGQYMRNLGEVAPSVDASIRFNMSIIFLRKQNISPVCLRGIGDYGPIVKEYGTGTI